ncbi:MAG: Argininosuccinate lyase [Alphaproteobacteria bacterium MarineAlpha8_Bin1]|nr:MAG: Argininosuccinate lyase [Alphaproteobacteria bacterium MarineAlpha8_Bin1]
MKKTTNPLWGGRFEKENSTLLSKINNSISFDYELGFHDIKLNKVYAHALKKAKLLTNSENQKIQKALSQIEKKMINNNLKFKDEYEDIHMNVEMFLKEKIGDLAGKIHTGKSRNDQVVTDLKMWIRDKSASLSKKILEIQKVIVKKAEEQIDTIMPGFTHSQNAQPILFSHYLMCIFEMLERDKKRFNNLFESSNECPLGSGALVGTNFYTIDREFIAKELGFKKPTENSLDSVSDRDFVIEFAANISFVALHLSRIAEDLIIWSGIQYNFVKFPDSLCTGSSIMPQKKNPDAAELIRSKSGRIFGSLINIFTILKGLPLGYSKDLQEDKEPIFDSYNTIKLALDVINEIFKSIKIDKKSMMQSSMEGYTTATDLADWMVKNLKISFREAHKKTGKIVLIAERSRKKINELSLDILQSIEPRIKKQVFEILTSEKSIEQKSSYGGTSKKQILNAIKRAKRKIQK